MGNFLQFLELAAIATWFGAVVFISFFVAPTLFRSFEPADAGKAVRALFPKYYLLGIVCAVLLCAVHITRGFLWYWGGMIKPSIVLFLLLTLIGIYLRQTLTPAINAARDAGLQGKSQFDKLHKRSVRLNGIVLLCLLFHLTWMAMRGY